VRFSGEGYDLVENRRGLDAKRELELEDLAPSGAQCLANGLTAI
jgi:hypothetical protein